MESNTQTDISSSSSAIQPAAETAMSSESTKVPAFSNVPWPVRPSPGINYDFVVMMYLAGAAIALFFYTLETQILAPLLEEEGSDLEKSLSDYNESSTDTGEGEGTEEEPWKEFAKGMAGMHLIFVPFIPCLLWSFIVRYYWMRETNAVSAGKKDN